MGGEGAGLVFVLDRTLLDSVVGYGEDCHPHILRQGHRIFLFHHVNSHSTAWEHGLLSGPG